MFNIHRFPRVNDRPFGNQLSMYELLQGLARLLGKLKWEYIGLLIASCGLSALEGIVHPLLIKEIFDLGVVKNNFRLFGPLAGAYLVLGLLVCGTSTIIAIWLKSLQNRLFLALQARLLDAYYRSDYTDIVRDGVGIYTGLTYGDLRDGIQPLLALVQSLATMTVLLFASTTVLFLLSWKASALVVLLIPLVAVLSRRMGSKIKLLTSSERQQEGELITALTKALNAFRMVKGFGYEKATTQDVNQRLLTYLTTGFHKTRTARIYQGINESSMVAADFSSLFIGALFVIHGTLTFGAYLAFVNTFWRALSTLTQLFSRVADFHTYGVIVKRLESFINKPLCVERDRVVDVNLTNVTLVYKDDEVLKDLNMVMIHGEKILIKGPNGSGKTSLANIAAGYIGPSKGSVKLPSPICAMTLPLAFPQLRVRELLTDKTLMTELHLHSTSILEAFPDELSAGQRQRLAVAIALAKNAEFYIFDEPLSNLDEEGKSIVMRLIAERTRSKTLMVILHDSSDYEHMFDRVLSMNQLSGLRDDLLINEGEYDSTRRRVASFRGADGICGS